MGKVGGTTGLFFRDLIARGFVPEKIARGEVYSGWDLSEGFHHKANLVFPLLKQLFQKGATYEKDGKVVPLVRFCQPYRIKAFLGIDRRPDAIAAFEKELMGERTYLSRDQYLTAPQLSELYGHSSDWMSALLQKMYEQKITYEADNEKHLAVVCYAKGDRRIFVGLKDVDEAKKVLQEQIEKQERERREIGNRAVSRGRGFDDSIINTLVANTSLDKKDIENLGHGFYNRVSAVRRQMKRWNDQGHSFRRMMTWTQEGHKGECKVPFQRTKEFWREVELLKGIILLAEFCKDNHLDFHKEFAADCIARRRWRSR